MMQRKPGFPVANCSIKMPDSISLPESCEEDGDQQLRRQQLINFGHTQWGFNNWNWAVTKQELDFVDTSNGKYCAGVVAFVMVSVKSLDIHRENIGYATSVAGNKGLAIHRSRKVAVTNALRETLLSFGGPIATELTELLETQTNQQTTWETEPLQENNQNLANVKENPIKNLRKDEGPVNIPTPIPVNPVTLNQAIVNKVPPVNPVTLNQATVNQVPPVNPVQVNSIPPMKNAAPIAKAHPIAANLAPPRVAPIRAPVAPTPAPIHPRPNSNDPIRMEGMTEEEARAERKRRQRQAQEEFRQKQLVKQNTAGLDEKAEKHMNSFDQLLMQIPTQDIVIEETGVPAVGKRKSPTPTLDASAKRRASISKLDILLD